VQSAEGADGLFDERHDVTQERHAVSSGSASLPCPKNFKFEPERRR
jgi:hypothetical protein